MQRHIAAQHGGMGYCLRFMDYISGRQTGLYPQSSDSTLRQKPFKSLFDVWCGEFIKEDARQKASKLNSVSYPAWGQNAPYANQSSESPDTHSLIEQERVQVVGYCGHICEECLQIDLLSFTNKFKPQVINHKCIPENLVKSLLLSEKQKSDMLREGHIQIPFYIRDLVIHDSKDGLIFLHAIRDPSDGRGKKIKSIPPNQYDWSARAIRGGCTPIDHRELTEFLIQANPASYGVFVLSHGETPAYYIMAVTDTPILHFPGSTAT
ncbi:MAG TPA: hypothetical protein VGK47_13190 [Nitrososphaeraceae archaeon]